MYSIIEIKEGLRFFKRALRVKTKGFKEYPGDDVAICKAIIEAHNGTIWAESIKGISSTFHFTLPKRQNQARN